MQVHSEEEEKEAACSHHG